MRKDVHRDKDGAALARRWFRGHRGRQHHQDPDIRGLNRTLLGYPFLLQLGCQNRRQCHPL